MVSMIQRDHSIRLRLAGSMKERLETLAQVLGVPSATLASVAVGQWVAEHEALLGALKQAPGAVAYVAKEIAQANLFQGSATGREGVKDA